MLYEPSRSGLDQIQHAFEAIRPTIVWVRHLADAGLRSELQNEPQPETPPRRLASGRCCRAHEENSHFLAPVQLLTPVQKPMDMQRDAAMRAQRINNARAGQAQAGQARA